MTAALNFSSSGPACAGRFARSLAAHGDTMVKGVESVVDNSGRTTAGRIAWPHTNWRVLDELKQEPRG